LAVKVVADREAILWYGTLIRGGGQPRSSHSSSALMDFLFLIILPTPAVG
jgi:hypothetical protein